MPLYLESNPIKPSASLLRMEADAVQCLLGRLH